MMDAWTEIHLDTYIQHHVPKGSADRFKEYALQVWAMEPAYWNNLGWGALYELFMREDTAQQMWRDKYGMPGETREETCQRVAEYITKERKHE